MGSVVYLLGASLQEAIALRRTRGLPCWQMEEGTTTDSCRADLNFNDLRNLDELRTVSNGLNDHKMKIVVVVMMAFGAVAGGVPGNSSNAGPSRPHIVFLLPDGTLFLIIHHYL